MAEPIERLPFLLREAVVVGEARTAELLLRLAQQVESVAKFNASNGAHAYGEPRPPGLGGGPMVVSGDLRRSITHQKVPEGYRVGPSDTPHTAYTNRRRVLAKRGARGGIRKGGFGKASPNQATSGEIGRYLETGLRNGAKYPFLGPAFDDMLAATDVEARVVFEGPIWT